MDMSRRDLLTASALLLGGPKACIFGRRSGRVETAAASGAQPIVLCWNENPYGPRRRRGRYQWTIATPAGIRTRRYSTR